jgi:hypothetical protein
MQNKANRRPLAGNPKLEILNPKHDEWMQNDRAQSTFERHDFKKQSQFGKTENERKPL